MNRGKSRPTAVAPPYLVCAWIAYRAAELFG